MAKLCYPSPLSFFLSFFFTALLFLRICAFLHEILSDLTIEDANGWLLIAVGGFSAKVA